MDYYHTKKIEKYITENSQNVTSVFAIGEDGKKKK